MKTTDISGTKKREYLTEKINELAMKCKNKNIRDLYRGINEFKRGQVLIKSGRTDSSKRWNNSL
jgi:hypothetical protein